MGLDRKEKGQNVLEKSKEKKKLKNSQHYSGTCLRPGKMSFGSGHQGVRFCKS